MPAKAKRAPQTRYFTRAGDKGTSGLIGGERVPKNDPRLTAYGAVDELNAAIGVAAAFATDKTTKKVLGAVMNNLFTVGAELASLSPKRPKKLPIPVITKGHVTDVERAIETIGPRLRPQKTFLLPGGTKSGALIHLARTIARRTERDILSIPKQYKVNPELFRYINRLSSLLFVLARYENRKIKEKAPQYGEKCCF